LAGELVEQVGEFVIEFLETTEEGGRVAFEVADLVGEVEAREDSDAGRIAAGGTSGDLSHELVHGVGEVFSFTRLAGRAESVRLLKDDDSHQLFVGRGSVHVVPFAN